MATTILVGAQWGDEAKARTGRVNSTLDTPDPRHGIAPDFKGQKSVSKNQ